MLKSPRRELYLPKLQSILIPRTNIIVMHQQSSSLNDGHCSKVNVEFKSPSKKVFTPRHDAIESICSFQQHILRKLEKHKKEKGRYHLLSAREGSKQNEEQIFVKRDRLSINRKNMHHKMMEYAERVSSSMKKPKPVRLDKISSQDHRPNKQWQLSGWNEESMQKSMYFDFKM